MATEAPKKSYSAASLGSIRSCRLQLPPLRVKTETVPACEPANVPSCQAPTRAVSPSSATEDPETVIGPGNGKELLLVRPGAAGAGENVSTATIRPHGGFIQLSADEGRVARYRHGNTEYVIGRGVGDQPCLLAPGAAGAREDISAARIATTGIVIAISAD